MGTQLVAPDKQPDEYIHSNQESAQVPKKKYTHTRTHARTHTQMEGGEEKKKRAHKLVKSVMMM